MSLNKHHETEQGMISLANADWDIVIDPQNGCIFHDCRYKGVEIFRSFQSSGEPDEFLAFQSGHFPLLPFSNRIANGKFEFGEKLVELPHNAPNQKHPLHGFGWISEWQTTKQSTDQVEFSFVAKSGDWPWRYEASHSVGVKNNTLRLQLSVTNTDSMAMPVGLGFHPYFPDLENALITFESDGHWQCDADALPTNWTSSSGNFDFSKPRQLSDLNLDNCFTGIGPAQIRWANSNRSICIKSSSNLNRAALYTDHENNCFCFEPVSHTHNAINMDNPEAEGIVVLDPGQSMSCWSEFEVTV